MLQSMPQQSLILRHRLCHINNGMKDTNQAGSIDLSGNPDLQALLFRIQIIQGGSNSAFETAVGHHKHPRHSDKAKSPNDIRNIGTYIKGCFCDLRFALNDLLGGKLTGLRILSRKVVRNICIGFYGIGHNRRDFFQVCKVGHAEIRTAKANGKQQP